VLVDHNENFHYRHRRHLLCPTLLLHHNRDQVPSLDRRLPFLDPVGHTLLVHHLDHRRDHPSLALVASALLPRHRYRVHRDS
jgi:hypothetical protein